MDHDTLSLLRAGRLRDIRRLDLSCGLTEFPPEIFSLADSLEILNLSANRLTSLPHDLHRLHRLQVIFCSDNAFTELPPSLGSCTRLEIVGFKANRIDRVDASALPPRLRWLILTDNRIENLPDALSDRPRLQKLMLAGNRLTSLPSGLARCTNLELIRIAANRFEAFPECIERLPKLSWLAFGGNPSNRAPAPDTTGRQIHLLDWQRLTLGRILGEGASGIIYEATDASRIVPRQVAVKIFKGAVTSDGLPDDELAAGTAAGDHPALVGAIARISGHPDGKQGLIMSLVNPEMQVLGGPPSLATCTRDVYPAGFVLQPAQAMDIAIKISAAAAHLHSKGILHGDLYAHNILHDGKGGVLLGDFGAATLMAGMDTDLTHRLQKLEVRAYGCLLEELIACTSGDRVDALLTSLRDECLAETPAGRPTFSEIQKRLD
ncbi:protein kinase [Xylophilus sp. Kf1]|nr:protein kinase [Xylophilus sp. Kf1]